MLGGSLRSPVAVEVGEPGKHRSLEDYPGGEQPKARHAGKKKRGRIWDVTISSRLKKKATSSALNVDLWRSTPRVSQVSGG